MIRIIKFLQPHAKTYWVIIAVIWGAIEMITYFTGDLLKKGLGSYWWCLFLTPLPFIFVYVFLEYFRLKPVKEWVAKINSCNLDVKLYGEIQNMPLIEPNGSCELSTKQASTADQIRGTLLINESHAMVSDEPDTSHTKTVFRIKTLDFAMLKVLRDSQKNGFILSACSVIICRERRSLIVHQRADTSETYGGSLHTIGGAYQPTGPYADEGSLRQTARREAFEELGASILIDDTPPMVLALEPSTKFIQLVFLGANISAANYDLLKPNWEGKGLIAIPFDDLESWLINPEKAWVPSGKAHILSWLAYGAPNAGVNPKFGKYSPKDLFKKLLA